MMRSLCVGTALLAGVALLGQQPGEVSRTGRVWTSAGGPVSVPVIVTDSSGQPIAGLTASDFQIKDNGHAVTLAGFHAETRSGPRQRSIAFLFDDLSTDAESLDWARRAAADYVIKGGVEGDRWAVLTTSRTLHLDYTSDRAAVTAVLDKLATQGKANQATQLSARAKTDVMHGGGTADEQTQAVSAYTLDGISNALAYAGAQPGRSVLIFTSTGFPTDFPANGTDLNSQVEAVRQAAIRSGVTVGSVDPAAINPNNSSLRWQLDVNVLSALANSTGGAMIENRNELSTAYDRLGGGDSASYELEFTPASGKNDNEYHHLEVTVAGHAGARVQARPGYYPGGAGDDGVSGPPELAKNLEKALAGENPDGVPIEVKMAAMQPAADAPTGGVALGLLISPRELPFTEVKGKQHDVLRVIGILDDGKGAVAVAREGIITLNLSEGTRKQLDKSGIPATLQLPVGAGSYRLRIIVQEANQGKTTLLSRSGLRLGQ